VTWISSIRSSISSTMPGRHVRARHTRWTCPGAALDALSSPSRLAQPSMVVTKRIEAPRALGSDHSITLPERSTTDQQRLRYLRNALLYRLEYVTRSSRERHEAGGVALTIAYPALPLTTRADACCGLSNGTTPPLRHGVPTQTCHLRNALFVHQGRFGAWPHISPPGLRVRTAHVQPTARFGA